jgi:hypothetical protein
LSVPTAHIFKTYVTLGIGLVRLKNTGKLGDLSMSESVAKRLRWRDALVAQVLGERRTPVVSNYWLAVQLYKLVFNERTDGRELQLPASGPDGRMLAEARNALLSRNILYQDSALPSTLFRVKGETMGVPELMCSIDPFGHVAYLSAMSYHGLTNRLPKVLYFVSPNPALWKELAREKMLKDLGSHYDGYIQSGLPKLRHAHLEKLDGVVIEEIRTKDRGGWRSANEGMLRVTGIGKTFVDMLQRQDICGGIRHVLDVFEEHAPLHLSSIIAAFDTHGTAIDKVRAGYILEEHCGVRSAEVEAWTKFATRGGSRKLDPQAEYSSHFSAKWSLSLNV